MNIFRKFASMNSKGVIGESSDSDLHPRRLAEVRPCEWPHTQFMEEAGILQEFTQYAANAGPQQNVNSIISSQTSLFKVLLSFLGIILLRYSLINMLKPVRYHLLNFLTYA